MTTITHPSSCAARSIGKTRIKMTKPKTGGTRHKSSAAKNPLAIRLTPNLPPVSVDDLSMMLEIDLLLGRKKDFRRRLRRALESLVLKHSH